VRHDYDLPADYERRVEAGEMVNWYTRDRVRRQAQSQETAWRRRADAAAERRRRRHEARSDTTSVDR
jgi:hypothetical protein